ncbi:MAG: dihydroorotate dehydrogenase electron transfer subunit, partial [Clostridia bacterium]|nr:dihydroorotate dehydrogenase electron transfer subunit [Clostridia bacterium]
MKQSSFKVLSNEKIAKNVYKMILSGDTSEITSPGQFVNLLVDSCFLRRPISVCDVGGSELTLVYKVVGTGTKLMSKAAAGDEFDTLTGLGNGYDLSKSGGSPLLLGGGVGVPPLYMLAKSLVNQGRRVSVVLGFNTKDEI